MLDFVASLAFGAGLGAGVMASSVCVLITEGGLTLLASALSPYLTERVVGEMSAVGGVLLLGLSINLLGLRQERMRVANMLPGCLPAHRLRPPLRPHKRADMMNKSKNTYTLSILAAGCLWGFMGLFRRYMGEAGFSSSGVIVLRCGVAALASL